jgi:AraC-like DNA-binding protein
MKTIVEYYQWIEAKGAFNLRTVPNGRVDAWITSEGCFEFVSANKERTSKAPALGFFPLTETGSTLRVCKHLKTINIKFLPHVLIFKPMQLLQQSLQPLPFQDLFDKKRVTALTATIRTTQDIEDVIHVVEQFFGGEFMTGSAENKWIQSVFNYIESLPEDKITVSKLAAATHVSVKTMERRFLQNVGISPKMFCKIIRFQNAVKEIQYKHKDSKTKVSSVSLASGYYDQSHFVKEARHFTGLPPKKMMLHFAAETSDVVIIP